MERSDWSILRAYVMHIYIHTYHTSSNLYTPDSVSLALLTRQLLASKRDTLRSNAIKILLYLFIFFFFIVRRTSFFALASN